MKDISMQELWPKKEKQFYQDKIYKKYNPKSKTISSILMKKQIN